MKRFAIYAMLSLTLVTSLSCAKSKKELLEMGEKNGSAKRYHLKGKVVSIDKQGKMANIDSEAIPDFMGAMTMPYTVKPESDLDKLKPGDAVTADVVVQDESAWLENISVTGMRGLQVMGWLAFFYARSAAAVVPNIAIEAEATMRQLIAVMVLCSATLVSQEPCPRPKNDQDHWSCRVKGHARPGVRPNWVVERQSIKARNAKAAVTETSRKNLGSPQDAWSRR